MHGEPSPQRVINILTFWRTVLPGPETGARPAGLGLELSCLFHIKAAQAPKFELPAATALSNAAKELSKEQSQLQPESHWPPWNNVKWLGGRQGAFVDFNYLPTGRPCSLKFHWDDGSYSFRFMRKNNGMGEGLHTNQQTVLDWLLRKPVGTACTVTCPISQGLFRGLHQNSCIMVATCLTPSNICFRNPSQHFHAHAFDCHLSGNISKLPSPVHAFLFKLLPLLSNHLSLSASSSHSSSFFLAKRSRAKVFFTEFLKSQNWKTSLTLLFWAHQVNYYVLLILPPKTFLQLFFPLHSFWWFPIIYDYIIFCWNYYNIFQNGLLAISSSPSSPFAT